MRTKGLGLTEEQKAIRKTGLSGTDIAAIAGLHPYCSGLDVWLEKTGKGPELGITGELDDPEPAEWGHRLEGAVAEKYLDEHPEIDREKLWEPRHTFTNPSNPWHLGSPDRLVVPPGGDAYRETERGVEIKCPGYRQSWRWGEEGTDSAPAEYVIQCQWYMPIFDLGEWDLVALIGGQRYREYKVERDEKLLHKLTVLANHFRETYILPEVAPPLGKSAVALRYLRANFPGGEGEQVLSEEIAPETYTLIERWRALAAAKKNYEKELEELKIEAQAAFGNADRIKGDFGTIVIRDSSRVSWKELALELGADEEAIERHRKTTPRVLYPYFAKPKKIDTDG